MSNLFRHFCSHTLVEMPNHSEQQIQKTDRFYSHLIFTIILLQYHSLFPGKLFSTNLKSNN